jgi:EAL domain-containing protein (putative c-di-GMP-specific phosphodiesterase class I)
VRELGCTDVQGYFYSRPVPIRDLLKLEMFAKQAKKGTAAA